MLIVENIRVPETIGEWRKAVVSQIGEDAPLTKRVDQMIADDGPDKAFALSHQAMMLLLTHGIHEARAAKN